IMHCTIKIGDSHIMACDNPSGETAATRGSNISLAIGTDDIAKAEKMFNDVSAGGSVTMPMQQTFWAERFGMLTDKFGVNWMFNCDKPQDEVEKAAA
ncbi:MAG: VOC family protein, partial [Acidobacteria bacterium]|nr:VOC family protein [Acidobacteriota bacterium]MCA1608612.1 VOC family protein [Acidobacteriota bacterium]